ncbi:hypothetical protein [Paractinoplanes atraurantiacus]|uniref:hypothetical protein n=1 Tax=Paractinoplanes atraurantiacus TaxID=1036182 RepID=UPI000BE2D029|nr:hypothetical protein [Actinoplanes atraurantiacus]
MIRMLLLRLVATIAHGLAGVDLVMFARKQLGAARELVARLARAATVVLPRDARLGTVAQQ